MTEKEWLVADNAEKMLDLLRRKVTDRKLRLFACACCYRIWPLLTDQRSRTAVELSELYADGEVDMSELTASRIAGYSAWFEIASADLHSPADRAAAAAFMSANHEICYTYGVPWNTVSAAERSGDEQIAQACLIRDIFGNPFRPLILETSLCTPSVTALAQGIYNERAFDRLPQLADALEEAGCMNADILNHCRQPGDHVRGCWVVDLLLGKG